MAMQKAKTQARAKAKRDAGCQAKPKTGARERCRSSSANALCRAADGLAQFSSELSRKRSSAEALYRKLSSTPSLAGKGPLYVAAGAVTRLQVRPYSASRCGSGSLRSSRQGGQACFPVAAK